MILSCAFLSVVSWRKYTSYSFLHSTFQCVSLCPEKAAQPSSTDDRDLERELESPELLPYSESRCRSLRLFLSRHFALSCSPSGCKVPARDLQRDIGSSFYPRLVKGPVRTYYLFHEWTCLFLSVTAMRGICCSKAAFVCSLIILYLLGVMECAGWTSSAAIM